jgi:hypothetical protein
MIYFVQSEGDGSIKIGFTSTPFAKRLETLKTGSPHKLKLLGIMPGLKKQERQLHRHFSAARMSGEWFRPTPELLAYILENAGSAPDEFMPLADIDPALWFLYRKAASYHKDTPPRFCANAVWYGYSSGGRLGMKEHVCKLVGWEAGREKLRNSKAYDIAYDTIYEALPDCRPGCACQSIDNALLG